MTSKLYDAVDELFTGESLFEVVDFERGFVGKYLQSPGYLAALVNDYRSLDAHPNELHVFFVNDDQVVVGQLLFHTDDIEVPQNLSKVNFIEGFIGESADELNQWGTITVAYGTHYNKYDIESLANDWFWSDDVLDVIDIKDGRWSSAMCEGGSCCPPNGTEIQPLSHYESNADVTESVESISLDELLSTLKNTLVKLDKE